LQELENLALLFSRPDKAFDNMIIAELNNKPSALWIKLGRVDEMNDGMKTFRYNISNPPVFTSLPNNPDCPMIVDGSRGDGKTTKNDHGIDVIFPLNKDDVLYIQSTTMLCSAESNQNYKLSQKLCKAFYKFKEYIDKHEIPGRATFVFASLHDFDLNGAAEKLVDSQDIKVIKGDDWKNCVWPFRDLQNKSNFQIINDMDENLQNIIFVIVKSKQKLINETNLLLR
jgi:hypothetical protein